jgi:peptide deformylase
MTELKRRLFGNPILRKVADRLNPEEIASEKIQSLIASMYDFLDSRPKYGIGLAAPQIGRSVAISVISIKPTPHRPVAKREKLTIINPEIVAYYGRRSAMWEGCISFGTSSTDFPYAQTHRYKNVRLKYTDEQGNQHERDFAGLMAHVIQHEVDHLNGILYVDRVRDPMTYMMKSEYIKMMKGKHDPKS